VVQAALDAENRYLQLNGGDLKQRGWSAERALLRKQRDAARLFASRRDGQLTERPEKDLFQSARGFLFLPVSPAAAGAAAPPPPRAAAAAAAALPPPAAAAPPPVPPAPAAAAPGTPAAGPGAPGAPAAAAATPVPAATPHSAAKMVAQWPQEKQARFASQLQPTSPNLGVTAADPSAAALVDSFVCTDSELAGAVGAGPAIHAQALDAIMAEPSPAAGPAGGGSSSPGRAAAADERDDDVKRTLTYQDQGLEAAAGHSGEDVVMEDAQPGSIAPAAAAAAGQAGLSNASQGGQQQGLPAVAVAVGGSAAGPADVEQLAQRWLEDIVQYARDHNKICAVDLRNLPQHLQVPEAVLAAHNGKMESLMARSGGIWDKVQYDKTKPKAVIRLDQELLE